MACNRVPRSVSLAIEAARASLAQITGPSDLSGSWQYFDWEVINSPSICLINLEIRISGAEKVVEVSCDISPESHNPSEGTGGMVCYITNEPSTDFRWVYRCTEVGNRVQATLQKRYTDIDISWLNQLTTEIRQHARFDEFQKFSPNAAHVIIEGGRIHGVSIDAAVTEFEKFISIT